MGEHRLVLLAGPRSIEVPGFTSSTSPCCGTRSRPSQWAVDLDTLDTTHLGQFPPPALYLVSACIGRESRQVTGLGRPTWLLHVRILALVPAGHADGGPCAGPLSADKPSWCSPTLTAQGQPHLFFSAAAASRAGTAGAAGHGLGGVNEKRQRGETLRSALAEGHFR